MGSQMKSDDLDGAFRQFYIALSEPSKIVYEFDGKQIGDLQNIWGTRTDMNDENIAD